MNPVVVACQAGYGAWADVDAFHGARERTRGVSAREADGGDAFSLIPYLLSPAFRHFAIFDNLPAVLGLVIPVKRERQTQEDGA